MLVDPIIALQKVLINCSGFSDETFSLIEHYPPALIGLNTRVDAFYASTLANPSKMKTCNIYMVCQAT
jgi:hypothetical protein